MCQSGDADWTEKWASFILKPDMMSSLAHATAHLRSICGISKSEGADTGAKRDTKDMGELGYSLLVVLSRYSACNQQPVLVLPIQIL